MLQDKLFETEQSSGQTLLLHYNNDKEAVCQILGDLDIDFLSSCVHAGNDAANNISLYSKPSKRSRVFREVTYENWFSYIDKNDNWRFGHYGELATCINIKYNYALVFVTGGDMCGLHIPTSPERVYAGKIGVRIQKFLSFGRSQYLLPKTNIEFTETPRLFFVALRKIENEVYWEISLPLSTPKKNRKIEEWDIRMTMNNISFDMPPAPINDEKTLKKPKKLASKKAKVA